MKDQDKVTLNVNVFDEDGNPVNEKEMTKEQIEFCAKVASKKYKKFSASTRRFNAEEESIDVTLPENIDEVDIDQVVDEAAEARESEAKDPEDEEEVIVDLEEKNDPKLDAPQDFSATVRRFSATLKKFSRRLRKFDAEQLEEIKDELKEAVDNIEEITECKDDECKEFAAKLRKFSRKMRKFDAEELNEVKEELENAMDTVDEIQGNEPEEETIVEACKQFAAKIKKTKKFSSEDLAELEQLEGELQNAIDADPGIVVEEPITDQDGIKDIREFSATKVDKIAGDDSLDSYKAKFFAACK